MEHVLTRETPINHRVHRNKESVAKEGTVIDRCKKKKKKKKRILFVRNSHQFHPTAIFPAREHFPSPPRPFFRESREQSRSHTSPIPSPPPPLEARPRPTSAVEHRPLLIPLFLLRVEEGRVRAETARGVGVVPGASHQRRRPTDRPTVPTERSPLSQASIKPGAVERVVPILPSAIGAHAPLPHPLRAQHASNATSSSTSRAGVAAERGCVQQHGGSTKSTSGRTEKNGAYAESHESRIDREINGWTWSRVQ